jgi:ATP-binding protein involved in chromosome partitioning
VEKYGVKVMSLAFFMNPNDPVIWRGPMATKAITQLVDDTRWGFLNFLVVDMPPGTGDIPITVAGKFPDASAVVVITPQKLAMADGRKAINMFRSQGISIKLAGIVENMSWFTPEKHPEETYFLFGRGGGQTLAEECDTTLIAQIPLVADVCEAGDSGQTIYGKPHKQIVDAFANLTDRIIKIHSSHVNA